MLSWQCFVLKFWQAAPEAGLLHVMDAAWCAVITPPAHGFGCSSLPLLDSGREEKGGLVSSMETLRCRGLVAEPRQGEVMLETCSPPVTTCQGVRWRCGQGRPLGAGRGTGLGEQRRRCEGTQCVRGAGEESNRDALGSLGEITFCSLSDGGEAK